jgi:hypothetical protein
MSEFLFHYNPVHPTTWVYLSSLLMICVFFKFNRFWSVRNLDLFLLILLSPGLLLVLGREDGTRVAQVSSPSPTASRADARPGGSSSPLPLAPVANAEAGVEAARTGAGRGTDNASSQFVGFIWLLSVCGLFLVRLLLDPAMVRRPLLEPNLSPGGLAFMGCSLFVFLMANVVNSRATEEDLAGPRGADQLLVGVSEDRSIEDARRHGPGNALLHFVPSLATVPLNWTDNETEVEGRYVRTAKAMAILSHMAVLLGVVAIGYWHFENIRMGVGAGTLYLMLPYTSQLTGRVDHVLPAALLVWAVLCYRKPLTAGMLVGFAVGVIYYPLFLLPLWISFYWQRGLMRFVLGVLVTLSISILSLGIVSTSFLDFVTKVQGLFGIWFPLREGLQGVWGLGWDPIYRLPVLAAFVALSGCMAIWPVQKNLGTLLSCSAAVMVATQFWHGFGGGLYVAWYLPLLLLTVFRPNLEDRVALSVLGQSWFQRRRRTSLNRIEIAA